MRRIQSRYSSSPCCARSHERCDSWAASICSLIHHRRHVDDVVCRDATAEVIHVVDRIRVQDRRKRLAGPRLPVRGLPVRAWLTRTRPRARFAASPRGRPCSPRARCTITRSGRAARSSRRDPALGRLVTQDGQVVEAEAIIGRSSVLADAAASRRRTRAIAARDKPHRPHVAGGHGRKMDIPARAFQQDERPRARDLDVVGVRHEREHLRHDLGVYRRAGLPFNPTGSHGSIDVLARNPVFCQSPRPRRAE